MNLFAAFLSHRKALLIGLLFFAAAFLTYGSSIGSPFVSWDDTPLIVENRNVRTMNTETIGNVFTSYDPELYIPLTFVSYQIDDLIGGGDPSVFHFTNLVIHTLNALLVVWLLALFLGSGWIPVALGLLFLLHPLNTEAVVWASARKDTLSTFFLVSSLISYVRWRQNSSRFFLFPLSIFLFLLGLLSKVTVIMLPVVLILSDLLEGRRINRRMMMEKIPFFVLSVIFGVVAVFGKTTVLASSTPWQKILVAAKSTAFYLEKFVVPYGLSFAYPYTKVVTILSPDFFIPVLVCIALCAVIFYCWKNHRILSFALSFFMVTLVPTFVNFSKGGDFYFASDRYAYAPMIGLLIALGALIQFWLGSGRTERDSDARKKGIVAAVALILIGASIASALQAAVWSDSKSLYLHALRHYPDARVAHHNLGMELLREGDAEGALESFARAFAIKDDPKTHVSRGAALVALRRYDEAMEEYRRVIAMVPDEADAYYGIGNIHFRQGNLQAAIIEYEKALAVKPDYVNALNNLGAIFIELERWDDAISILQRSIELHPDFVESYYNIAGAYEEKGMTPEAEQNYLKAIELNPQDADAFAALASLLYKKGDIDAAAQSLQQAFDIDQNNATGIELLIRMRADGVAK